MNQDIAPNEKQSIQRFSERVVWIDIARGFVIFYMIITLIFPQDWFSGSLLLEFLFVHPPRVPGTMHLVDLGAPGFVLVLGLLLGVTFQKRKKEHGVTKAIWHVIYRYGLILTLGIFILLATWDFAFMHWRYDRYLNDGSEIYVFISDVVLVLGLVGFVALPFLFIDKKYRIYAGYGLILFYTIMLALNDYTKWINDAVSSVHLGIWFGIFGYGSITIIASALGEYLIGTATQDKNDIYLNMAFFGTTNVGIGLILAQTAYLFIVGGLLIAIGGATLGLFLFIFAEKHMKDRLHLFEAYGKYPFFVYLVTVVPWEVHSLLVDNGVIPEFGLIGRIIAISVFWTLLTGLLFLLYFKKKRIKTEWVAIAAFALIIIIVLIAWPLGWL
jgi:hypothetical protein